MRKYALFVGRWQPFHSGHKYIIDQALSQGKDVCIAIRNTRISDQDPFTIDQRREMIRKVYGAKVKIIAIPDIESINIGRKVGYDINEIAAPEKIANISGTDIRQGIEKSIPREVDKYLRLLKYPVWFTGLPCSGKTTLALRLKQELEKQGYKVAHLDGDDIRKEINKDLSFSDKDRHENLRRVTYMIKMFKGQGNLTIASFVSPTNHMRKMIKDILKDMKLIYLKCSLEECERRDNKGMYKKARQGLIKSFTGISAPFEEPATDLVVDTEDNNVEECVKQIMKIIEI